MHRSCSMAPAGGSGPGRAGPRGSPRGGGLPPFLGLLILVVNMIVNYHVNHLN